jgi:predicted ATP-grasp superfamily ATP-dependent carboligase
MEYLINLWRARPYAELDPEDYYDYQVNRPIVATVENGERTTSWPTTSIYITEVDNRRLVLVSGIEPSMRWRHYCAEILELGAELGVDAVISVGALLADVPHTRPLPVTATSDDADLRAQLGIMESDYNGPTGIVGVLQDAATAAGLEALSIWATVPHYVANPPSPKATLGLLMKIEELTGLRIDLGPFPEGAEAWLHGVEALTADDEDIADYVKQLEENHDTIELPEASGDAIAKEFEHWLRRRDTD